MPNRVGCFSGETLPLTIRWQRYGGGSTGADVLEGSDEPGSRETAGLETSRRVFAPRHARPGSIHVLVPASREHSDPVHTASGRLSARRSASVLHDCR